MESLQRVCGRWKQAVDHYGMDFGAPNPTGYLVGFGADLGVKQIP